MITVIAGVNGAGKSSIAGARLRSTGGEYFNPDEVARSLMDATSTLSLTEANATAWRMGFDQLSRAIDEQQDYTIETTLGGNSICQLLHDAIDRNQDVRIFFAVWPRQSCTSSVSPRELQREDTTYRAPKSGNAGLVPFTIYWV